MLALLLAACAGRVPKPVAITNAGDNNVSCEKVQEGVTGNSSEITALRKEEEDKKGKIL
jgi:hypothetical protein